MTPGLQERLHQRKYPLVLDPPPNPLGQRRVPDLVETRLDIGLQYPLVGVGCQVVDLGDRVLRPSVRAEPIRARQKVRLENRFKHRLQAGLDHPIGDSRDTELAEFSARFGYHHLPHFDRPKLARL